MNMSMRIKFTSLVASALLLGACSAMAPSGGDSSNPWSHGKGKSKDNVRCKTNATATTCSVEIDYEDPTDDMCGDYCFAVAPAYIIIDPSPSDVIQYVEWHLKSGGNANFDTNGIAFQMQDGKEGPFRDCAKGKVTGGDEKKSFHCSNAGNQNKIQWKYTINLKLDDGVPGTIQATDPWVVNK